MRLSRYFLPVLKETPKEAEIVSHQLMLRAGMIKQQAAGSYSWLPLGFKVLNKVSRIIVEEQNRSGAVQLLMPTVQSADLWRESGRYDAYGDEMLRIKDLHKQGATDAFYRMFVAYLRTFHRMGLVGIPMQADSGPIGGDMSYEFHVLASTRESAVFLHKDLVD